MITPYHLLLALLKDSDIDYIEIKHINKLLNQLENMFYDVDFSYDAFKKAELTYPLYIRLQPKRVVLFDNHTFLDILKHRLRFCYNDDINDLIISLYNEIKRS